MKIQWNEWINEHMITWRRYHCKVHWLWRNMLAACVETRRDRHIYNDNKSYSEIKKRVLYVYPETVPCGFHTDKKLIAWRRTIHCKISRSVNQYVDARMHYTHAHKLTSLVLTDLNKHSNLLFHSLWLHYITQQNNIYKKQQIKSHSKFKLNVLCKHTVRSL